MDVTKHAAIKREEEEIESEGWEGNEAEGTGAEGSCDYTAETKTKHGRKKVLRVQIRANKVLSDFSLTTETERGSGGGQHSSCSPQHRQ